MAKITGADRVMRRLQELPDEVTRAVGQALFAGGERVQADAQILIRQNSAGGQSGGKHQHVVSRPGEPPNELTGHLASQIEVTKPAPLVVQVTSNAKYSAALEFGTSKMAARPFMGPAARAARKDVKALVTKAVAAAVRKG